MKSVYYLTNCYARPSDISVGAASRHYYNVEILIKHGYSVNVITNSSSTIGEGNEINSTHVHQVKSSKIESSSFISRAINYIQYFFLGIIVALKIKAKPDLIIASTPSILIALQGWLLSTLMRTRLIIDVRDLWTESLAATKFGKNKFFISINDLLEYFLYKRADLIFCTTMAQKKTIESRIRGKEIVFLPNGFDFNIENSISNPISESVSKIIHKYKNIVLFAGKHSEYTNLDIILDVAKLFNNKTGFLLIGGGYDKERLIQRKNDEGIKNVHFDGPVPKDQIYSIMMAADIFIVNYSNSEAWAKVLPNKLYDYMYFNKPILAAVCDGEITRLLRVSNSGIQANVGDPEDIFIKINKLLNSKDKYTGGREYLQSHFNRNSLTNKFYTHVSEVVD